MARAVDLEHQAVAAGPAGTVDDLLYHRGQIRTLVGVAGGPDLRCPSDCGGGGRAVGQVVGNAAEGRRVVGGLGVDDEAGRVVAVIVVDAVRGDRLEDQPRVGDGGAGRDIQIVEAQADGLHADAPVEVTDHLQVGAVEVHGARAAVGALLADLFDVAGGAVDLGTDRLHRGRAGGDALVLVDAADAGAGAHLLQPRRIESGADRTDDAEFAGDLAADGLDGGTSRLQVAALDDIGLRLGGRWPCRQDEHGKQARADGEKGCRHKAVVVSLSVHQHGIGL